MGSNFLNTSPLIIDIFMLRKNTRLKKDNIWVYILDLKPSQMIEYGEILPKSGGENKWFKNLGYIGNLYLFGYIDTWICDLGKKSNKFILAKKKFIEHLNAEIAGLDNEKIKHIMI